MTKTKLYFPGVRAHGFSAMRDANLVLRLGRCDCIFRAPASANPVANDVQAVAKGSIPVGLAQCDAINRDVERGAAVVCLFRSCGPAAVFGRVRPIVVDSLNGVLWTGLLPHVGEKVCSPKWPEPAVANLYAAPSVPVKHVVGLVATAAKHASVASVHAAGRYAVRRFGFGFQSVAHAPTGFCASAFHRVRGQLDLVAASIRDALKQPHGLVVLGFSSVFNGFQKAIGLAGNIQPGFVGHFSTPKKEDYMLYRIRNNKAGGTAATAG